MARASLGELRRENSELRAKVKRLERERQRFVDGLTEAMLTIGPVADRVGALVKTLERQLPMLRLDAAALNTWIADHSGQPPA